MTQHLHGEWSSSAASARRRPSMVGRPSILRMSDRDPITEAHRQWVEHGWTDAADGMALMTSVVRAHQLVHERVEATLRPYGLTFARYEVLRLLAFSRRRSMPMSQLGSLLQVHATSVTSAVDRLEKQGLVERLRRESDRRVVLASLTSAGEGLVERATADLNAEVFSSPGLAADDVAAATRLLTALRVAHGDSAG